MKRMFTLRTTLTVISLAILCLTVSGVLLVSFINSRSTVRSMASELMVQQSKAVEDKVISYLGPGTSLIEFLSQAVLRSPEDIDNWQLTGEELIPLSGVFPQFSWIYYAEASSGRLLGVNRIGDRYVLHRGFFDQDGKRKTFEYTLEEGQWIPYYRTTGSAGSDGYDPRDRPWYQDAAASEESVWTRPYLFYRQTIQGITVARAHRDAAGKLLGVYAIDVVLDDLKSFLGGIQVGENGLAMMFYGDGEVMVAPDQNEMAKDAEGILVRTRESITEDLADLAFGEGITLEFYYQNIWYLARISKLGGNGIPEGYLAVVVPAFDIFQVARDNALWTVIIVVLLVGLSVFISIRSARIISAPLSRVSSDMAKIAKYDITLEPYEASTIYEMAVVTGALEKMKASLRAFGRYVPSDLVRAALESGQEAEVGGKTQEVSILFADLAGFTSMSEHLSPDEVFAELSVSLEVLTSGPEQRGGSMLTFLGDGILVVFNAPKALKAHPEVACASALEILEKMQQLNRQREHQGRPAFHARIGINTGEVLVGNVGIKERFSYSVLGDAVNLASRLEGLNKIYGTSILAGEDCYQRSKEVFEWRMVDRISVVGRAQAEKIYEPLGYAAKVSRATLEARDAYARGWEKYLARQFSEAMLEFEQSLKWRSQDQAAVVMIERCKQHLSHPPGEAWTGCHQALSK